MHNPINQQRESFLVCDKPEPILGRKKSQEKNTVAFRSSILEPVLTSLSKRITYVDIHVVVVG